MNILKKYQKWICGGVHINKRMYVYKHYVLFANLAEIKNAIINVPGVLNKIIVAIMWFPGKIKTKLWLKKQK